MKKIISTLIICCSLAVQAQTDHLVISQVYGAGGNTGAPYTHDFVELYNPTSNAVSLAGWSLQYAGASTNNWNSNIAALSGTIAPGKYFLIQFGSVTASSNLPTPDLKSSAITISATAGKIALVNNTALLPGNCPLPNAAIVDFVGYGTADCAEGTKAVATSITASISRINNGCTDNNNNSTDFVSTTPSPRNSTSAGHTCNGTSISITNVSPAPFCVDASNGTVGTVAYTAIGTFANSTFKAVLSDVNGSFGVPVTLGAAVVSGTNPSGTINISIPAATTSATGYRIRIEASNPPLLSSQSNAFEIINGAKNLLPNEFSPAANNTTITLNWVNPSGCYDEILIVAKEGSAVSGAPSGDGSGYTADSNFLGNGTPFNGGKVVYKGTATKKTIINLTNGTAYYFKAFTRRGTMWSSGTEISDKPRVVPLAGEILINQLSPSYNGSLDEYIELVNVTGKPFDLSDLTIRVKNSNGITAVAGASLSGTIEPHSYWLILPLSTDAVTVGKTVNLPADTKMDLGFSNTSNQVALIRKTDSAIIDAVGYGTIYVPTYTEGTPAANPPAKGGLKRIIAGADNNNNRADFTGVENAAIELRNSKSRLANEGASIQAGNYTTLEVTGNASLSGTAVFSDKVVLTNGLFSIGDNHLTAASITAGTSARYIRTNGIGALTITNITSDVLFPVGNSTYNPVTISNGSGLDWRVRVGDVVAPLPTPFGTETAVQRTWNITPSATPLSGATVVFEYSDADLAQVGSQYDKTKPVQVWNFHNGNWLSVTGPQTPVAIASERKAVTLSNYRLFSPFSIANVNTALPVHFTDFSVRAQAGGLLLQFTNALEKDVASYDMERSINGRDFERLAQLAPLRNDNSAVTYQWLDARPPAGEAWYRVKGVDLDGTMRYTPVLKINAEHRITYLTLYPNPVHGRSVVWQATLPQGTYQLRLNNSNGQQVLLQTFEYTGGNRTETLQLPAGLQPGIYYLQISNGRFTQQQSFIVL